MSDDYKTAWTSRATESEKKWGFETTVGTLGTITAKILFIDAGHSTSLKHYVKKNEILFLRKGKLFLEYDSEKFHKQDPKFRKLKTKTISAGEVFYIQSGCPYRITAIEVSEIIEIGDCTHDIPVKLKLEGTQ